MRKNQQKNVQVSVSKSHWDQDSGRWEGTGPGPGPAGQTSLSHGYREGRQNGLHGMRWAQGIRATSWGSIVGTEATDRPSKCHLQRALPLWTLPWFATRNTFLFPGRCSKASYGLLYFFRPLKLLTYVKLELFANLTLKHNILTTGRHKLLFVSYFGTIRLLVSILIK